MRFTNDQILYHLIWIILVFYNSTYNTRSSTKFFQLRKNVDICDSTTANMETQFQNAACPHSMLISSLLYIYIYIQGNSAIHSNIFLSQGLAGLMSHR